MVQMNLHEVKTHLSKVARLVKSGETIIVCERNKPFAEIRALPGVAPRSKRQLGLMKGLCPVTDDFFAADAEIAAAFNDGPVFPPSAPADSKP